MGRVLAAIIGFSCAQGAASAEPSSVAVVLKRTIIDPELPLKEVQAYTEGRVAPMPRFRSLAEWQKAAELIRSDVLTHVVFRGEAARWREATTDVVWLDTIEGGPGYRIRKLRYEALPGLWIPALLYEPEALAGSVPVVVNVNGHDGNGKAARYKQIRCINQAKRGMLALNVEWLGMGQLRTAGFSHARMNQLDLCGTSGLAPFYLSMKRGIDVVLSLKHADPERVAVAGLSGGGWQTSIISALDTRVTLSNPVAGYSSFRTRARHLSDLGDAEQTPVDLASLADYTHLTAMRAPRPTLLTYNATDNCCFASGHALPPLLAAARPIFTLAGCEGHLRWHVNHDPGNHNFEKDNREALYRMFGDFFFPDDHRYDPREIPSDAEVKPQEQLHVELPAKNADFHSLALALARELPRGASRSSLPDIVRARSYGLRAEKAGQEKAGDLSATYWRLIVGNAWTVPAVELVRGEPNGTAVLVADEGRASAADAARELLDAGQRVVALDPFYFGESRITKRAWLYALLVSSTGDRPLGLQASQLTAVARWLVTERRAGPVTIVARGPRSSTFALVAAALEEEAVAGLVLHDALPSLKDVIEKNWTVDARPELFCFGLLEAFDMKQLKALVAPRPVTER